MKLYQRLSSFVKCRQNSYKQIHIRETSTLNNEELIPKPAYNFEFYCNPANRNEIFDNIKRRESNCDIDKVLSLSQMSNSKDLLIEELSKIPNNTHPEVLKLKNNPRVLKICGTCPEFNFSPFEFEKLAVKLRLLRIDSLGPVSGQRSYIFLGDLADLEQALIHYTLKKLLSYGFKLVSVPEILPTKIIERCGLIVDDNRTLVYQLDSHYKERLSLSGTAEMALAYSLMNSTFKQNQLPLKLAAVSRCFRAEASSLANERGIYRVHQFTKVEMFVCSEQEKSESAFNSIIQIQEDLFSDLGLHFKILDMPPNELGASAFRKIDMEGWLPGRKLFGELSSCSNCTDYQSRRLNIKYKSETNESLYVHTLNGTGCAVPRMMIAICESYQLKNGLIAIPDKLQPFMAGKSVITKQSIPEMRIYKYKPRVV